MALYSKYRPQNFANLVGQEHIRQTLLHEIQKKTLTHAYLFAGPRGTGKTSTARLIAKALNCTKLNAEGEPCETCDFCTSITEGRLIDVIEIDAASNRGIDEIRDLKEKIQFAPTHAKTKVYIIDEVHMLTKEAFNALLKTLEEPPENVYFILCTTEIHKIPETIISRCQRFDFKRIDTKTIMTRLSYIAQTEKIEAEDAAIELIARHSEGGLRDAIGLMEQLTIGDKLLAEYVRSHLGITGHQTIVALHDLLEKKEMQKAIHLINEVHNEGYDLSSFAKEILEGLRDKLISGIQAGKAADLGILEMISRFEEARDMLRNTVIPQLPLEIAVIKICGGGETMTDGNTAVNKEVKAKPVAAAPKPVAAAPIAPKMPEATPEATASEKETAKVLKKEFETEQFKEGSVGQHWARVTDKIQPPSLRRSLMEAKVGQVDDSTVKLVFRARFHFEKVNTIECRSKAETIITELFGKTMKVVCELDESELKMKATQEKAKPVERKKAEDTPKANAAGDLADKAMEIFGGDDF